MKIHADMTIEELVPLMGERFGAVHSQFASAQEAIDVRNLLVRDFAGEDTNEIDGAKWHLYCCAVDPSN